MRCKFCGLETNTAICEYCGYDNINGDGYDTGTVTSSNYEEPTLNRTNYGAETTAEHAAHAPYADAYEPQQQEEYIEDPTYEDYQNSIPYGNTTETYERSATTTSTSSSNSFDWKKFHWWIFIILMMCNSTLAFIYLFVTLIAGGSSKK